MVKYNCKVDLTNALSYKELMATDLAWDGHNGHYFIIDPNRGTVRVDYLSFRDNNINTSATVCLKGAGAFGQESVLVDDWIDDLRLCKFVAIDCWAYRGDLLNEDQR